MRARVLSLLLFGALGTALLVALGVWQLQRLAWKEAMLADIRRGIDAAPVPLPAHPDPSQKYLPVTLSGSTTGEEILVLSGTRESGGGYQVVSAFQTADGRRVMVDRGFIPEEARRAPRPPVPLAVRGNLHWPDEIGAATPAPNLTENIWFARDVPAMAAQLHTEPVLVVAAAVEGEAQGATPIPVGIEGIPNNHLSYAVQWFLLAATCALMTGWAAWRMTRRPDEGAP